MDMSIEDTLKLTKRIRSYLDDERYRSYMNVVRELANERDFGRIGDGISTLKELFAGDEDLFNEVRKFLPRAWHVGVLGRKIREVVSDEPECQNVLNRTKKRPRSSDLAHEPFLGKAIHENEESNQNSTDSGGERSDKEVYCLALKCMEEVRSSLGVEKFCEFSKLLLDLRPERDKRRFVDGVSQLKKLFGGHDHVFVDLTKFFPIDCSVDRELEGLERKRRKICDITKHQNSFHQIDHEDSPISCPVIRELEISDYEQKLYDCEDELFQASIKLQTFKSTLENMVKFAKKIECQACLPPVQVEEGLGEENWRCVAGLFENNGKKGASNLSALISVGRPPRTWMRIILDRLKDKVKELGQGQVELSKRWKKAVEECPYDNLRLGCIKFIEKAEECNQCPILAGEARDKLSE